MMRVAYVAGPYRAPTAHERCQNIERARDVAAQLWRAGFAVLCPHMNTAHFDGIVDDQVFLDGALELMRRCDFVVLAPRWNGSHGTRAEIREALKASMLIYEWHDLDHALTEAHFNLD